MHHRLRLRRPSPAMLIAIVALVSSFAGPALANQAVDIAKKATGINGSKIKARSIAGNKLKNNTVTGTQVNEGTLGLVPKANTSNTAGSAATAVTAANATALNGKSADSFSGPIRWALVDAAGTTIISQSGGISIVSHPFTGEYILEFGSSLIGHAILVTPSGRDNTFDGGFNAAPCGTSTESYPNCAGSPNTRMHVFTEQGNGTAADRSFYVAVLP